MSTSSRAIFEVRTAKDSPETPEAAIQFLAGIKNVLTAGLFQRLLHTQPTITLEIASLNQSVHFVVTVEPEHAASVKSQITAQYPTTLIADIQDYLLPWSRYGAHAGGQLVLTAPSYLPLKIYTDYKTTDPLSTVLGVMGKTTPGTAMIFQLVLAAAPRSWSNAGHNVIKRGVSLDPLVFKAHPQQAFIEQKLSAPAFHSSLRLLAVAPSRSAADHLLEQTASSFGSFALSGANSFKLVKAKQLTPFLDSLTNRDAQIMPAWSYLNLNELASLYHFPGLLHAGLRNLAWGKTIKGEAP